jgi:hypothetical protein
MEVIQNNKSCSVITLIDFNALRQIIWIELLYFGWWTLDWCSE